MRKGIDCKGKEWEERELTKNMSNIRNQKFGKLTALFPVYIKTQMKKANWLCLCECGNEIVCRADSLKIGDIQSCGCKNLEVLECRFNAIRDAMIGKVFGELTVVSFNCLKPRGKQTEAYYWCQCSCGSELVSISGNAMKFGLIKSCGCLHTRPGAIKDKRFGKLVARKPTDMRDSNGGVIWECDCDCGNTTYVSTHYLNNGHTASCGCENSLGESNIIKILIDNKIIHIYNKSYFKDLKNKDGNILRYDFILVDNQGVPYRIVEFDGPQHAEPHEYFGGQEAFERLKEHDALKNQYALSHNIPLVRIPYSKRNTITIDDLLGDKYLFKGEI